jgi:hypothetical protein
MNIEQVRGVMERQAEMERALMQQHETLRHENGMLWQQIEISRRNQDALNSKLSQVISTFQHIANRLSTSRPSKILAPNGQQLIEYQDNAGHAEEEPSTPLKRTRCAIPSLFHFVETCCISNCLMLCEHTFFRCDFVHSVIERNLMVQALLLLLQCSDRFLKSCVMD